MAWLYRSRKRCDAIPHAGDLYVFRGARGNLIRIFGMTVSACRSTPKGWRKAASSGHRRVRPGFGDLRISPTSLLDVLPAIVG